LFVGNLRAIRFVSLIPIFWEDRGIFKTGDIVNIILAYDFINELVFSGFIAHIKPGSPWEFHLEDQMYVLKRGAISHSFPTKLALKRCLNLCCLGTSSSAWIQ
jgi:hypothetical protein